MPIPFASGVPSCSVLLDLAYENIVARGGGRTIDVEYSASDFSIRSFLLVSSTHRLLQDHPDLLEKCRSEWPKVRDFSALPRSRAGQRAFARVFLATEPALGNRRVVVKVSLRAAEAQTPTSGYPNVVPILSVRADSRWTTAICMPYVERAYLRDVVTMSTRAAARQSTPARFSTPSSSRHAS